MRYYLNHDQQPNGDHEVHQHNCSYIDPSRDNYEFLGYFDACRPAVTEARVRHSQWRINGCFWCARPCHTG